MGEAEDFSATWKAKINVVTAARELLERSTASLVVEETAVDTDTRYPEHSTFSATWSGQERGRLVTTRGIADELQSAVIQASANWRLVDDGPISASTTVLGSFPLCPHRLRHVSSPDEIESLAEGLRKSLPSVDVSVHTWRRRVAAWYPDERSRSCESRAWTVRVWNGDETTAGRQLLLETRVVDAGQVDVSALTFEIELASAAVAPRVLVREPSLPVLVAPTAVRELSDAAADMAYSRGFPASTPLVSADAAPSAPGGRCIDILGAAPEGQKLPTLDDEIVTDGSAYVYQVGIDVPIRAGHVVDAAVPPVPWRRPADAYILLSCRSLAPAGLMSGPGMVINPEWGEVRGGAVVARWTTPTTILNLPATLAGVHRWEGDGTWRLGDREVRSGWWHLSKEAIWSAFGPLLASA